MHQSGRSGRPSEIVDSQGKMMCLSIFFNREPVAEDMMQWEKLYYVGCGCEAVGGDAG